jgi:hypothetical protein
VLVGKIEWEYLDPDPPQGSAATAANNSVAPVASLAAYYPTPTITSSACGSTLAYSPIAYPTYITYTTTNEESGDQSAIALR